MNDPLTGFDWSRLYDAYDAQCNGFNGASVFLGVFESCQPKTDRSLYYQLAASYRKDERELASKPIAVYEALLYWKLYSQPAAVSNMHKWLRESAANRERGQQQLLRLFQELPKSVEKDAAAVVDLVKWLGVFQLPGMASPGTLPVRTTFLHFLFPAVIPIFDKMVLKAVGRWAENANHKTSALTEYLPFAWELADRYDRQLSAFGSETPIRALDMALWVGRGRGM